MGSTRVWEGHARTGAQRQPCPLLNHSPCGHCRTWAQREATVQRAPFKKALQRQAVVATTGLHSSPSGNTFAPARFSVLCPRATPPTPTLGDHLSAGWPNTGLLCRALRSVSDGTAKLSRPLRTHGSGTALMVASRPDETWRHVREPCFRNEGDCRCRGPSGPNNGVRVEPAVALTQSRQPRSLP